VPVLLSARALLFVTTTPIVPFSPAPAPDRLLRAFEVAELLQVTPAWVYAETRKQRLPHVRLGRYVRYRREAIDAWLAETELAGGRTS